MRDPIDHGVTADGIGWRLESATEDERALVARIKFDLSLVPDAYLSTEWARRAARKPGSGRQRILRPCPKCGEQYSTRMLRNHLPVCSGRVPAS
jgi:hypothetical protein